MWCECLCACVCRAWREVFVTYLNFFDQAYVYMFKVAKHQQHQRQQEQSTNIVLCNYMMHVCACEQIS